MKVTFDIYNRTENPEFDDRAEATYEWVKETFENWQYDGQNTDRMAVSILSLVKAEVYDRDQSSYIATFQKFAIPDQTYTFLGKFGTEGEFVALANLQGV